MEPWQYIFMTVIGCVAGFLNVMAGGGSLITMPVMIFMGFPPAVSNGTTRVALVAQNATAIAAFRHKGFSDFHLSLSLGLCTLPGAILGSVLAVKMDPLWFKRLLVVVMVGVLISMFWKHDGSPEHNDGKSSRTGRVWAHLAMVGIGFYGGFIQAGVGFILMAVLHRMLRLDLIRVNMHKVFIVGMYMLPSLLVFAWQKQVHWWVGVTLALGNAAGAWIATNLQIKRGENVIRIVFIIAVLAMAIKLLIG